MLVEKYCNRLGLEALPPATAAGLAKLELAQRQAIPFENLDVLLGREIRIDEHSVFNKLILDRRGGYCFEQNILLASVVRAIGIPVRPVLAGVWLGAVAPLRLTHMALVASLDDGDWLMDAGFGGGYCPPIRLVDGAAEAAPDGSKYLLSHDAQGGWMFARSHKDIVTRQFGFDLSDVLPADIARSNRWTSTHPDSRFTRHLIVNRISKHGRASLTDRKFERTGTGEAVVTIDSTARLMEILNGEFALHVSNADGAILAKRIGIPPT